MLWPKSRFFCLLSLCLEIGICCNPENNKPLSFSNSFNDAGETSECLLSSGLRGGANAVPLATPKHWVDPSFTSEWRLWSVSSTGISRIESVDSCGGRKTREAIFLRHTLQRQEASWSFKDSLNKTYNQSRILLHTAASFCSSLL